MAESKDESLSIAVKLREQVLTPVKSAFVGKDEIVDLMGICLVARENLFLFGPPGTAKSAIVRELAARIEGNVFDYLLTRFTEPNELFGPFDIRKLRDGELVTNTEGMLPEAAIVFLDELLNANSAILNSLLMVLNERVFRRGRETRSLPTLMVIGASNNLPEDAALGALFDRFLMRVVCDNVPDEHLQRVLHAGWDLEQGNTPTAPAITVAEINILQGLLHKVDLAPIQKPYLELVQQLRKSGIAISDRRAVKLQRLIAASALLCNRLAANTSDLWVTRYIWDTIDQQTVLQTVVQDVIDSDSSEETTARHPRSFANDRLDPEQLSRDLDGLLQKCQNVELTEPTRNELREQLTLLAGQCQWISNSEQRSSVDAQVNQLWELIKPPASAEEPAE